MTITKRDIEKALGFLDADARQMFLAMPEEERDAILLSISSSNSNRLAKVEKWQIDFELSNRLYREKRERKENHDDDNMLTTTQKILKAIQQNEASKFNYASWFRDRVLPQVITLITLAILYLTFGQKIINP